MQIINTGSEVQITAIPTCKGEPCGWGDMSMVLDVDSAKLFDPEITKTGFVFGLLPVNPSVWGKVSGKVICLDAGKGFLTTLFSFDLVVLPGKLRPDAITISTQLSSASEMAVGG